MSIDTRVRVEALEERTLEMSARITAMDVAIVQAISDAHRTINRCLKELSDRVEILEKRGKKNGLP